MDAGRRQILGLALAIIGVLGTIIICVLPMWKVFINIFKYYNDPDGVWYGLWNLCVMWDTVKMECKGYGPSTRPIPEGMKAARVLIIIAIIIGVFGILLSVVGSKRTNFMSDERRKVTLASGVVFIIAGVLVLIPVCWIASIIIHESHTMSSAGQQLGASLYIGWFTTGLLFLGGGLLLSPQE